MRRGVRLSAVMLTLVLTVAMPLAASAGERRADDGVSASPTVVWDRSDRAMPDRVTDARADGASDLPDEGREPELDRSDRFDSDRADVRPAVDVRPDTRIDREVDRPIDRCHPRIVDNFRRCLNDRWPHDLDIRHLIWRLIKAHEWEKLIRLLHWLGWL